MVVSIFQTLHHSTLQDQKFPIFVRPFNVLRLTGNRFNFRSNTALLVYGNLNILLLHFLHSALVRWFFVYHKVVYNCLTRHQTFCQSSVGFNDNIVPKARDGGRRKHVDSCIGTYRLLYHRCYQTAGLLYALLIAPECRVGCPVLYCAFLPFGLHYR